MLKEIVTCLDIFYLLTINIEFQVWLVDMFDRMANSDYFDKVLLPETLTKIYQDFFKVGRKEAVSRLELTAPSSDQSSSDDN